MHIDICNTMQCVMEYLMLKTKQIDMNINEINIQIKVLQSISVPTTFTLIISHL